MDLTAATGPGIIAQVSPMEPTVDRQRGVMAQAMHMVPMAARLHGVMVPESLMDLMAVRSPGTDECFMVLWRSTLDKFHGRKVMLEGFAQITHFV